MQALIDQLIAYGPAGMFVAAFLAGSFLPFSSEVVMVGLLGAGVDPTALLVWGTVGNVLGSVLNYGIGTLGREEWITHYAHVSPEKLERGKGYVQRYGAWAGLLAFLPALGTLIVVAMGYLRTPRLATFLTITGSKYLRYQLIVSAYLAM